MTSVPEVELRALLDHLAEPAIAARLDAFDGPPIHWDAWTVSRVSGSLNNRIYRAKRADGSPTDLAIKLTIRDHHNRADREYNALRVLERAGLSVGPRPLLLDQDRYQTPVVVMTWLDGVTCLEAPTTEADWRSIVELFTAIHSVTPERVPADLRPPTLSMRSAAEGLEAIRFQLLAVPPANQPAEALDLLARLEACPFPTWTAPPSSLSQGDANCRNLLKRSGTWAAVDWEYSGWGDPAFAFTTVLAHVAYLDVPPERLAWARDLYLSLTPYPGVVERLAVYLPLAYGQWVARFARMLYEVPRGADRRLTPYPDGWLDAVRVRYERYLDLAHQSLLDW
ncbi:MAG: phosphotransferase family protein [Chloroflexota bacterium]